MLVHSRRDSLQVVAGMLLALLVLVSLTHRVSAQAPSAYDALVQRPPAERSDYFDTLSPSAKASAKREHARRWLEEHRARLTTSQLTVVEEAIAYISPTLWADAPSAASLAELARLQRGLECAIGRDGVLAAFTFLPPVTNQSWHQWADEWQWWLDNCLS